MLNFGFLNGILGSGGGTTHPPVHSLDVISSTIYTNNSHRIIAEMSEAVKSTGPDVRFQIAITINGGAPIVPNAVVVNGKFLTLSDNFKAGDVITWQYSTGQEKITSLVGKEMDTLVHTVDNKLASVANDWVDENVNHWVDENNNNWEVA